MEDKGHIAEQRDLYSLYFNQNGYILFLYKKSERLASAIYMISDFFPTDEPLRLRLREVCLKIVSETLSFSLSGTQGSTTSGVGHDRQKIGRYIAETIALLEVAFRTNLISEMNHSLLKKEYETLFAFLEEHRNDLAYLERPVDALQSVFFDVPTPRAPRIDRKGRQSRIRHSGSFPQTSLAIHEGTQFSEEAKKTLAPVGFSGQWRNEHKPGEEEKLNKRKEERRGFILAEIEKRGSVSVRDILPLLKGYSEKTVQRELLALVHEGILSKEGERRWSRYSMRPNS